MNSYELSRNWFNYCFDNPEKVKPSHTAVYFFAIEHCNRLGWKEKFGFPSQMVMEAVGIKNWRTYSKVLNDLVDFGFIKMIEISKNQYSSNIIAIVKNTKAPTKALDKALQKHSTKQGQSTVSIDKQLNKEQVTTISVETFLLWFNKKKELNNGVKGKFKVLTFTDENNLNKLLNSYNLKDFNYAIVNLFNSEWAKENNMITPSHFLRVENFNKYLNQEHPKEKLVINAKDYLGI
jgi:hypothetical protein